MKRKKRDGWLRRFWIRIVKSTSGRGCKIGIPDEQVKRRDR